MDKSYGDRVGSWYSDPFAAVRMSGQVTAKTVRCKDTQLDEVLVDAVILTPEIRDRMDTSVTRLLMHEGYHLLLRQARENAEFLMRGNDARTAYEDFAWIAAIALEEVRIESALCSQGFFLNVTTDDLVRRLIADAAGAMEKARALFTTGGSDLVRPHFAELAVRAAYAMAAENAGAALTEHVLESSGWKRWGPPDWAQLLCVARDAPDARHRVEHALLLDKAKRLIPLLERWLEKIGFRLTDESIELLND